MIQIRHNVFETNSSSVHSIVICTKKEMEDWKGKQCYFNPYSDMFIYPDKQDIEKYRRDAIENYKNTKDPDPYCINWDDLDPEAQERYIRNHVNYKLEQNHDYNCMTYDYYKNSYQEGCEYSERYYKTEHGDEIVVFGKGGYDG